MEPKFLPSTAPKFKEIWNEYEKRCYNQFLDEIGDDENDKEMHTYHHLKNKVQQCKHMLNADPRVNSIGDCHYKIRDFADLCVYGGLGNECPLPSHLQEIQDFVGVWLNQGYYNHISKRDGLEKIM